MESTAEICRYFGPATESIPADAWVAVRPGYYRKDRTKVLLILPDIAPVRGVDVDSDDLTAYAHDVPIRRIRGGWTLANPEDATLLAASMDASLSHVRSLIEDLQPTLDRLRCMGMED